MLIEQDSLQNWTKGSYESIRRETAKAIYEGRNFCEINFSWKLLATYQNHALIVSDKGEFYRCKLQETSDFGRKLVAIEKVVGPKIYQEDEKSAYYENKTSNIVANILAGNPVNEAVISLMSEDKKLDIGKAIGEQLQRLTVSRKLWNSYYEENEHKIMRISWRLENRPKLQDQNAQYLTARSIYARSKNALRGCDDKPVIEALKSVIECCEDIEYWLNKSLKESKFSSVSASHDLTEYLQKMDALVTFTEGL